MSDAAQGAENAITGLIALGLGIAGGIEGGPETFFGALIIGAIIGKIVARMVMIALAVIFAVGILLFQSVVREAIFSAFLGG